jgi:hypothetical protein
MWQAKLRDLDQTLLPLLLGFVLVDLEARSQAAQNTSVENRNDI